MNWSMRKAKTRKTSEFPGKTGSLVCNEYITPGIIKFPFWKMIAQWPDATYACLNCGEAYAPEEIREKSICIDSDIRRILSLLVR